MKFWFLYGLGAGLTTGAITTDVMTGLVGGALFVVLFLAIGIIDSLLYTSTSLKTASS